MSPSKYGTSVFVVLHNGVILSTVFCYCFSVCTSHYVCILDLSRICIHLFSFFLYVVEEAAPPLPGSSVVHHVQENGVSTAGKAIPPVVEKPKRSGPTRGIEDVRPSVESLLNELESSVPAPQ